MINHNTLIGEIKPYAGVTLPLGYLPCRGQAVDIVRYSNLYAKIGNTYTPISHTDPNTFCLPDAEGKALIGVSYALPLGSTGGQDKVTLTVDNLPEHNHSLNCSSTSGNSKTPVNNSIADCQAFDNDYSTVNVDSEMSNQSIGNTGNNEPVNIRNPYLVINYIIYTGV